MAFFKSQKGVWLQNRADLNSVRIDNERFFLDFLDPKKRNSGSGYHSSVFAIVDEAGKRTGAIKFCNYPVILKADKSVSAAESKNNILVRRFLNEITALKNVRDSKFRDKAIAIRSFGIMQFKDHQEPSTKHNVLWFSSELAQYNLSDFLANNHPSVDQRISICYDILSSLIALHTLGIIHRDIKPANVVCVDDCWKFLDLGLSDSEDRELGLDSSGDKIGPFGYMSPEALNEHMGIKNDPMFNACCKIDKYSDVFQLGMLFWYIIRGEVTAGIIEAGDLEGTNIDYDFFHSGLAHMLPLRKERRLSCEEIHRSLSRFFKSYGI